MPKSHLPAHMDSVRQKCRPKHQLLILKCYPRLPKNSAADVKPNGSELSYLLYYAATRKSKLQKVGAFLERKTASDVYKQQSARVLVTLQILTALLENKALGEGSSLALIAPYVLRILSSIMRDTTDIGLLEATLKTWDAYCRHQDQAILAVDHEYRELYDQVVNQYAAFAHKTGGKKVGKSTTPVAVQDAIRLRETGLHALGSMLHSDALAFETGRLLLNSTVPAILSNLRGDDAAYLENLVLLSKQNVDEEKDKAIDRRQSMATVHTYAGSAEKDSVEADPRVAEGTAQDADALAEENVAVLALLCLKAVFNTENRSQVRLATTAVLNYLSTLHLYYSRPRTSKSEKSSISPPTDSWMLKIFELCTTWTPVQDRFILLVTAVETMVRLPLKELDLRQHMLYAALIDAILRSDLNLIGLSVMDVLLGLIQQTLRVLLLSSPPSHSTSPTTSNGVDVKGANSTPSAELASEDRLRLLSSLKACIADLATHIYYTDQISDMIAAILIRLKPTSASGGQPNPVVTAAAIEEPRLAVNEVASNVSLPSRGRPMSSSGFFSFDTARQVALEVVKDILKVANSSRTQYTGGSSDSRNPVHISIWEGTQWLLRDPSAAVRKAYAEALITWLELETSRNDFRLSEPVQKLKKKRNTANETDGTLARRAVSSASATKDRLANANSRKASSAQTFLQLLHLANYENALQFAGSSTQEILIITTLLTTLVKRLGVNAVASGLPMIFALQEDIAKIESPIGKVRIGSLVHGYLWTLVEVFDFPHDISGKAIFSEVARRKENGIWVSEIEYPMSLKTIDEECSSNNGVAVWETVTSEDLHPFDDRESLIDSILDCYEHSIQSPPVSAPNSPGRSFSTNALDRSTSYLTAKQRVHAPESLAKIRQAMVSKWSREECLAAIAAMAPKSVSLSGSHSSPQSSHPLVAQAAAAAAAGVGNHRQLLAATNIHTGPTSVKINSRLQSQSPNRQPSGSSAGRVSSSAAAKAPGVRVEELKKALTNGVFTALSGGTAPSRRHADESSESMVDVHDDDLNISDDGYAPRKNKGDKTNFDVNRLLATINVDSEGGTTRVGMTGPPY